MGTLILWTLIQYKVNTHEPIQIVSHDYSSKEFCEIDKEVLTVDNKTYAICKPRVLETQ